MKFDTSKMEQLRADAERYRHELASLQQLAVAGEMGEVNAYAALGEIAQRLGYLAASQGFATSVGTRMEFREGAELASAAEERDRAPALLAALVALLDVVEREDALLDVVEREWVEQDQPTNEEHVTVIVQARAAIAERGLAVAMWDAGFGNGVRGEDLDAAVDAEIVEAE